MREAAPLFRPLAATDRGRRSPFGGLLRAALHDRDAAAALSHAYESFPTLGRLALVAAVIEDAIVERIPNGPLLLTLLTVECDAAIAERIRDALATEPPFWRGTGTIAEGRCHFVAPTDPGGAATLYLAWTDGCLIDTVYRAHADWASLAADFTSLGPSNFSIDAVARVLWRSRGAAPEQLARFANVF